MTEAPSIWERLDSYQREAVLWAMDRDGSCIFMEQGTGKTWVTAGLIEAELTPDHQSSILCVVPLANLETTWVKMLSDPAFLESGLKVCRTWEEFKATKSHRLLLINYERVRPIIKKMRKQPWDLVIYDEAQRLKKRSSKQSKDAYRLRHVARRRVLLSGTPVEQAPQDLWAQLRFAAPEVLGERWADFEARWLKRSGYMGYELKFRMELLPKFLAIVEPHFLRITKEQVLDLPPLRYVRVPVDLLGDQRRVYDEITREMVAEVAGGWVTCDLAITQLVRQQQICGGFVRLDPTEEERAREEKGREVRVGKAKQRRLRALLGRVERPVVIFCRYREELAQIVEALPAGARYGLVRGGRKGTKRERTTAVESFQRGELDYLVCQVKAGGVGLDMFRACVAIFYSAPWSWIDFDQAVSRIHRRGQTRACTIYLLFAANTVDSEVYKALLLKKSVTELILRRRPKMGKKDKDKKADAKTETKTEEKKKPTPPPQPEKPKYGVPELAEALGVKPSSVRVRLRNAGIEKSGKLYGWDTKAAMQEVIEKLKAKSKAKADDDGDDDEEEEEEE